MNTTLIKQMDRGGEVGMFVRNTLRRALANMPADAVLASMAGEVSRGELRSARTVLGVATALADGRGVFVDPALREHTSRLDDAVQEACSDGTQGASGVSEASGVEGGGARKEVGSAGGLTFSEGMARLSIAFSIYAVFLAFLFVFRQMYHRHFLPTAKAAGGQVGTSIADLPKSMRPDA
ncbi:hypothetical protein ACERZ8_07935 [Tateyamaria armeniaca]|uniref:Uncharacterized protein n=1 Tax=Tateyamaria armeniaca TaxID=2518930 RepID=A0ABW8URQ0_9RHOB